MIKPELSHSQQSKLDQAVSSTAQTLIEKDPAFLMYYLLTFRRNTDLIPTVQLLRLTRVMERSSSSRDILNIYGQIIQKNPTSPDAETALYRLAEYHWNILSDAASAKNCLRELAKRFPNGPMTQFGRILWNRVTQPKQQS